MKKIIIVMLLILFLTGCEEKKKNHKKNQKKKIIVNTYSLMALGQEMLKMILRQYHLNLMVNLFIIVHVVIL